MQIDIKNKLLSGAKKIKNLADDKNFTRENFKYLL